MSYNIALVNMKLPEKFNEACEIVNELVEQVVSDIDPAYQIFYDEIIKIYPCLCNCSSREMNDSVWCDGPLINNFRIKAPVIGFIASKAEEALPVVKKLALSMGLSVLDWQTETVYNPVLN